MGWGESLPHAEEYLGGLLLSDGRMGQEIWRMLLWFISKETESKVKALYLLVHLCSSPHLSDVGRDQRARSWMRAAEMIWNRLALLSHQNQYMFLIETACVNVKMKGMRLIIDAKILFK